MRSAVIIGCGFVLWALSLGCAWLLAAGSASATLWATGVFLIVWFVIAGANMVIGITKAGYSFGEELPIFLLIFLLPSLVAVLVKWRWLSA